MPEGIKDPPGIRPLVPPVDSGRRQPRKEEESRKRSPRRKEERRPGKDSEKGQLIDVTV